MFTLPQVSLPPVLSSWGDTAFVLSVGHGAIWVLVAILVVAALAIVREALLAADEPEAAPMTMSTRGHATRAAAPEHREAA
jgi:hypothetical protein